MPVRSETQKGPEEKGKTQMLFRQLFDAESFTYTYLIASRAGGEAVIIDSVIGHLDQYLRLLEELDLKLVKVVDTHTHADHITGMGASDVKGFRGCGHHYKTVADIGLKRWHCHVGLTGKNQIVVDFVTD